MSGAAMPQIIFMQNVDGQDVVKCTTTTSTATARSMANMVKVKPGAGKPYFVFQQLSRPVSEIDAVDFTSAPVVTGTQATDQAEIQSMLNSPPSEDVITWRTAAP